MRKNIHFYTDDLKEGIDFKDVRVVLNNFKYYLDFFTSVVEIIVNGFPL